MCAGEKARVPVARATSVPSVMSVRGDMIGLMIHERYVLGIFVIPQGPRLRLSKLTVSVHLSHLASPAACCDRLKVFDSPTHAEQSACVGSQRHSLRSSRCDPS